MAVTAYRFELEMIESLVDLRTELYGDSPETALHAEEIRRLLSRSFSFHADPGNDHICFIARQGNKPVGHVTATVNGQLRTPGGDPVGAVGFFECIDDYNVATQLLDAAIDWLKNDKALTRIWGPIQFDIWHGYRFKTRGFNVNRFTGEPINKSYYPHFLERYGFKPKWQWSSVWIAEPEAVENLISHRAPKLNYLIGKDVRFTTLSGHEDLQILHNAIMKAFLPLLGFTPLPFDEFERLFLARCRDDRLVTIVRDPDDRVLAFALAYPNKQTCGTSSLSNEEAVFFLVGTTEQDGIRNKMLAPSTVYHAVRECFHANYSSVVLALMRKSIWLEAIKIKHLDDALSTYALFELEV